MKAASLLLLLGPSVALGLFLLWRHFQRQPNRPTHVAVHLLLGIAGLQALAMLRRGAPDGTVMPGQTWGSAAALLLVLAVLTGLLAPMLGRHWGRRPGSAALLAHALLGGSGFVALVVWLLRGG